MSEIPDAIERFDKAARDWGWQEDLGYDGTAVGESMREHEEAMAALVQAIDAAILAERERCAKIAETPPDSAPSCCFWMLESVAKSIRKGWHWKDDGDGYMKKVRGTSNP